MTIRPDSPTGSRSGLTATLLLSVLLAGCATSSRFSVDAVRRPEAANVPRLSYRFIGSPTLEFGRASTLVQERFWRDARTALSSKGLYEAPPGVTPALEVEIDFGLEAPVQHLRTHTEPVYVVAAPGRSRGDETGSHPLPRKIGERTVNTTVTLYPKFLRVTAREARSVATIQTSAPLWSVVVTNEDESDDLGRYARLMLAAAMDHLDTQSAPGTSVVLNYADGRVAFIAQGM